MIGVYAIKHIPSHRIYVGSSCNVHKRMRDHLSFLKTNRHHSQHLQNCWNKYGKDQFVFSVVKECSSLEEALSVEQALLDCFFGKTLFNAKNVAMGVGIGISHPNKSKPLPEEQKAKISAALKGRQKTKEHIEKVRQKNLGKIVLEKTKNRLKTINTKYIVTTPDGTFFGLKEAAKFYGIKGDTVKVWCNKKPGWSYESI
jgi:group I intron endonuclease